MAFLGPYGIGKLLEFAGIPAGIENTNYFVTTSRGRYVLTIFERYTVSDLTYTLNLTAFLAAHGVPGAHPVTNPDGTYLTTVKSKSAALVQRLPGLSVTDPSSLQCNRLGAALGRLHIVGQTFAGSRQNPRGPIWRRETADQIISFLGASDKQLLQQELAFQTGRLGAALPGGAIHGDLFRDNVLWEGDGLTGIIDFYHACTGSLVYDLGIAANDWCSVEDGSIEPQKLDSLISGYREQRTLTQLEAAAWPVVLRAAALRYWLSRLHAKYFPRRGEITHRKDPDVFRRILVQRIANPQLISIN